MKIKTISDAYTKHKPIRNKIKTYVPLSIIDKVIDVMHAKIDPLSPEEWEYLPWEVLLLVRWVYQYAERGIDLKNITDYEFHSLIKNIRDLKQQKNEKFYYILTRGMHDQISFQISDNSFLSRISRQLVMFDDLMESQNNLNTTFQDITGLPLKAFFELCIACLACRQDVKLSVEYFQKQFRKEIIQNFFSTLSLTMPEAEAYIREYSKNKNRKDIWYQINEHTPLWRYPFFEDDGLYRPYSYKLLLSSFSYIVYDIFKERHPDFSVKFFGKIFEKYITKGIEYKCLNFLTEKEIKSRIPKDSKCVDFL